MTNEIPDFDQLTGLWRRSLIAWPDGREDRETWVNWMQGQGIYIDLRQPVAKPDFHDVMGLRQLSQAQVEWIAEQEGFAGVLHFDGTYYEWRREIDFQPQAIYSDEGKLWFENEMMIEEGRDIPYIEHWHAEPIGRHPLCALRLEGREDGERGFLLRVGSLFMYARGRKSTLPEGQHLRDLVAQAPDLQSAQDLIDCEISQGAITSAGWIIQRSTLPYRDAQKLEPELVSRTGNGLTICDTASNGRLMERCWDIIDVEGDLAAFSQTAKIQMAR
tara:strand:- start:241033 stop:241854 length:822 start_codon:yes stop_codon:yes gene_type:complete